MDSAVLRGLAKLKADYSRFSAECLSIIEKEGGKPKPFRLNRAQRHVHDKLQQQLKKTGKVRALILKGRQQGISTYIGGRFYHRTSMHEGIRASIIAHETKATNNLFKMVKRFHENNPLAPHTGATNAQELIFDLLDSGYSLATAGTKEVGRSSTAQLLHGSEFGFWANANSHLAAIGNTVADLPGTEIILESTANGIGNTFHQLWQKAEAGEGEYIAIFVPWFWQDEYKAAVPDDFELSEDDQAYQLAYKLSLEQMAWRANKIATYDDGYEWLFDQEYPATEALAFKSPTSNPLISPTLIAQAVASTYMSMQGSVIIGCDPAGEGPKADRTAIVWRRGRVVLRCETHPGKDEMQIAGILASYWTRGSKEDGTGIKPDGIIIDKGGLGAGIYSRLRELNVPVIGINFAQKAEDDELYANKRAEIWWRMREWLKDQPCRLPDDKALQSDLSAPQPDKSSNGRRLLESKEDMEKRQVRSPDLGDALALTFAESVETREAMGREGYAGHKAAGRAGY